MSPTPRVKAQPNAAGEARKVSQFWVPPIPPPVINDGARKRSFGNLPQEERSGEKREQAWGLGTAPSPCVSRGRAEPWRPQTIPQPC